MSRPKGLPPLGQRAAVDGDMAGGSLQTPYRLPKLSQSMPELSSLRVYRVWSRYGYELYTGRLPDLTVAASQMMVPPKTLSQEMRRANLRLPDFQQAVIAPTEPPKQRFYARDTDPAFYKSYLLRSRTDESMANPEFDPSPTPIRSASPTKSVKSIHWALSPYKHQNFDKKGRSRVQGPYSREFTVTCSAPSNWLRMKWGRSKSSLSLDQPDGQVVGMTSYV